MAISPICFMILMKTEQTLGKIKTVVHTAGFTETHSMSSQTHLSTQRGTDDM